MINSLKHIPVMLKQSIKAMNIIPNGSYIDATFGFGGHSKMILDSLNETGKLYAVDKDLDAINMVGHDFTADERFTLKHGCFSDLINHTKEWGVYGSVNGILFDLGVSSHHLDDAKRGFSFNKKGIVDMRFDQSNTLTAAKLINNSTQAELADIIFFNGEERRTRIIAKKLTQSLPINNVQ